MIDYDPFSDEVVLGDPHPLYARLRDEQPVYRVEKWDAYALSRFEDVWNACADRNFSVARGTSAGQLLTGLQPVTASLNHMDPPEHGRLRSQLRTLFLPGKMRAFEPELRDFVVDALESLADREEVDLVSEIAQPLAAFAVCRIAGFPVEDADLLRGLVARFFYREPGHASTTEDGIEAMNEIIAYFRDLSARRRANPSAEPDAIGVFQAYEDREGRSPDDADVASHCLLLILGGTDTLPKVLANTLLRLHDHPDQRARVVADPDLVEDAFLEALRVDMPTQYMMRTTREAQRLHDVEIPAGAPIFLLYASANRDPREFSDPEDYRIDRRPPRSLGFSHGTHACLGIHAAKMEARVALREILRLHPEYGIESERIEHYVTDLVKGFASMPLRWRA